MDINLTAVRENFAKGFGIACEKGSELAGKASEMLGKLGEWGGRSVTVVKSGTEKALLHLQDVRIAALSLFAVNLILIEISDAFSHLAGRYFPHRTDGQVLFRDITCPLLGVVTWIGGVTAFSIYTNLPKTFAANAPAFASNLPAWAQAASAISGISLIAVLVRGQLPPLFHT